MRAPRLSVLMSVFNTESFVRDAITSVLSQTFDDLELLVVDDGSTDASWSMITAVAACDSRVLPFRCGSQRGASAALNEGLRRARGQYITRQDSDDRSAPTRFAEQLAFLERHPDVGAVGTAVTVIDAEGMPSATTHFPESDASIQAMLLDQMCFCGPTLMVRMESFRRAGYWFDETVSGSEDYDLCLRLAEVTSLANTMQPLYFYRQHPHSVSHTQRAHQLCRKAVAAEKALRRRFGALAATERFIIPARDYLRAAVVAHASFDHALARDCVDKATSLEPGILEQSEMVMRMVRSYAPRSHDGADFTFVESLFREVLPRTPRLVRLKRRLLSDMHMHHVFIGYQGSGREHFWRAIRNNPTWLVNPGVLSLLLRNVFVRNAEMTKASVKSDVSS
jgi:glycosyltransferase involved in cell wall biosynthesis